MADLDQVAAELQRLRLRTRNLLDTAVAMLEDGATRTAVVQHLETGIADLSPVRENAGRVS